MFQVLKDFLSSEKGVFGYALPLIIATSFVFLGRISEEQWMDFSVILAGIYTGGKALHGSASVIAGTKDLKTRAEAAEKETMKLKSLLASNDAAADKALEEKFPQSEK